EFNPFFNSTSDSHHINPDLLSLALPLDQNNQKIDFATLCTDETFFTEQVVSSAGPVDNTISPLAAVSFPSQSFLSTPLNTPNYCAPHIHPYVQDLEEFLAPLVSPAITPNMTETHYFTPLSSPALVPDSNHVFETTDLSSSPQDAVLLQQQLAHIEAKQQLLRDQMKTSPAISPTYRKSSLAPSSSRQQAPPSPMPFNGKKRPSLRQKIVLASPQLHSSQNHHIALPMTMPATPASLMKMSHPSGISGTTVPSNHGPDKTVVDLMPSLPPAAVTSEPMKRSVSSPTSSTSATKKRKLAPSPMTLKPLISPFLQPDARINHVGIENRRSAHKVAEQRRRDTLKQSFDSLRKEIAEVLVTEAKQSPSDKTDEVIREEKEKEVKFMSKVLLIQHSYEYIVRLKTDAKQRDDRMRSMQQEIDRLKQLLD
ncbi:uncharacterized protein B0P05DRAFT_97141, partial [Gilbertella persicaria]|uniref:uncharacterized protein n=1 Tax=Gilbertella persicaria TaxID=101096 RepID=UPI00221EFAE7